MLFCQDKKQEVDAALTTKKAASLLPPTEQGWKYQPLIGYSL